MTQIILPWPPKELNPNARIHHMAKAKVTKAYREGAYWLAYGPTRAEPFEESRVARIERDEPVHLSITFSPPDRRRRDLDGMLSSIKAGLDGIADAIRVNDQRFEFSLRRAEPVAGGKVVIQIGPPTTNVRAE